MDVELAGSRLIVGLLGLERRFVAMESAQPKRPVEGELDPAIDLPCLPEREAEDQPRDRCLKRDEDRQRVGKPDQDAKGKQHDAQAGPFLLGPRWLDSRLSGRRMVLFPGLELGLLERCRLAI